MILTRVKFVGKRQIGHLLIFTILALSRSAHGSLVQAKRCLGTTERRSDQTKESKGD